MAEPIQNKRNHGIVIFENSIRTLYQFLIPLGISILPALKSGELTGTLITAGIFMCFWGVGLTFSVVQWIYRRYSIKDGIFSLKYGVFVKKNREIPLSKLSTIHEMQTLSQRMFKAWTLKLDTGSSMLKETEVEIVVSEKDLDALRNLLKQVQASDTELLKRDDESNSQKVYQSHPLSLLIMGLTSNAVFAGLAIILSAFQVIAQLFNERFENFLDQAENYIKGLHDNSTNLFLLFLAGMIIYSIISLMIAAVGSLVKYYGFSVIKEKGNLTIQYGLLKRNSFTIPENLIHATYLKQSLLRQLLGYVSVNIESVGYGNEKGEEALLIPFARLSQINRLLNSILTGHDDPAPLLKVPKRSLRRFLIRSLFFPMLLIIPVTLFYSYGYISLALAPLFSLGGILNYRNSGVSQCGNMLYMGYGGFTRYFAHVRNTGIQAIIKKATPFQRAAGLFTLNVSIQGSASGKILAVKHLDNKTFEAVEDII